MTLHEHLREDLKQAMRSGDSFKRDIIRFLESALKNVAIEKRKPISDLTDAEVQEVIRRSIKQRKDSVEQYESGGRPELAEKEKKEMLLLQTYLPQAMDEVSVRNLVRQAVIETGAAGMGDFGRAMGAAMKLVAGQAEGDIVKAILEEELKK